MRSLLALTAALLGLVLASGCDATDIPATQSSQLPYPTATSSSSTVPPAKPTHTRSAKPSKSATTKPPATHSGTPSVTAAATDTANAGSGSTSGVPTSYAAGAARIAALHGARHLTLNRFSTTGDVVYCVLKDSMIPTSCELRRGAIRDPGVCGQSMTESVGRIQLGDEGADVLVEIEQVDHDVADAEREHHRHHQHQPAAQARELRRCAEAMNARAQRSSEPPHRRPPAPCGSRSRAPFRPARSSRRRRACAAPGRRWPRWRSPSPVRTHRPGPRADP